MAMGSTVGTAQAKLSSFDPRVDNCTFGLSQDSHYKAGQSDRQGDHKGSSLICRGENGLVIGTDFSLHTPQAEKGKKLLDTATARVTAGFEQARLAAYVDAGLMNGLANDIAYGIVGKVWEGGKKYRQSPSKDVMPLIATRLRYDLPLASIDTPFESAATVGVTALGHLGTDRVSSGLAAYFMLGARDETDMRVSMPGMPKVAAGKTRLYGAVAVEASAYEYALRKANSRTFLARALVGADYRLTDKVSVFAQATYGTKQVFTGIGRPVHLLQAGLTVSF